MSLDGEGNFMARWGVEMTTPKVLRDGRPRIGWGLFWFECCREK